MNDALNAALVERLFKSRSVGGETPIPVLVSQTKLVVHNLKDLSYERLQMDFSDQVLPALFGDASYLVVSESLLARAQGLYPYASAADEARMLMQDADHVADTYYSLLRTCRNLRRKNRPDRKIGIDDMPPHDWEMLLFRLKEFEQRWAQVLAPSRMVAQRDGSEYLQSLEDGHWENILERSNVPLETLQKHAADIRRQRPPQQDMSQLILARETKLEQEATRGIREAFEYSLQADDAVPLREILPGTVPRPYDPSDFGDTYDRTVAAIPSYISCGAALTLGTFRDLAVSPNRYIKVTWLHARIGPFVVEQLMPALQSAGIPLESATILICTPQALQEIEPSDAEVTERVTDALKADDSVECVQLYADAIRCFVDTIPLDAQESQVGIIVTEDIWPNILPVLPELISKTNEVWLSPDNVAALLQGDSLRLFGALGPQSGPRGALAP